MVSVRVQAIDTYSQGWSEEEDSSASSIQSTLWSVILRTRDPRDPNRIAALLKLSTQFSIALYAYARSQGATPGEARDSVQGFIGHVRDGKLTQGTGHLWKRLRSFLLRAFDDYFESHPARTPEPGAEALHVPETREFAEAESWYGPDPSRAQDPEKSFNRAWARAILVQSHAVLQKELASLHGASAAEVIAAEVSSVERRPFNDQLAGKVGLSVGEILQILKDSRRRLREIITSTLRETVSTMGDAETEFWDLFRSV